MNIISNTLKKFENYEQAEIAISFCCVDNEFTVVLKTNEMTRQFVNKNLELALGDAYVVAKNGE